MEKIWANNFLLKNSNISAILKYTIQMDAYVRLTSFITLGKCRPAVSVLGG